MRLLDGTWSGGHAAGGSLSSSYGLSVSVLCCQRRLASPSHGWKRTVVVLGRESRSKVCLRTAPAPEQSQESGGHQPNRNGQIIRCHSIRGQWLRGQYRTGK